MTNVTDLHKYLFNDYNYKPSNTVLSFSEAITTETGKGLGDEEGTGVEADHYTKSSQAAAENTDTAVSDTVTE